MKSDIIVKQFIDMLGRQANPDLQNYLDGKNEWNAPIMATDIIQLEYSFSPLHNESMARKFPTTGILLLHKIPI
jgi:hypothetical protein